MTGPIPQDANGYSLHWDVKTWDQELAFSHSASSVTASSFPLFAGVTGESGRARAEAAFKRLFF